MKYISPSTLPLLEVLAVLFPQSSKNTLRSWIKEGRIEREGVTLKNSTVEIVKGQAITIGQRKKIIHPGILILYEDRDYIVIDKPSGLLSVATNFEKGETVHALLKLHYHPRKIFVVHRLDQDTSGVMVFAFSQEACDQLKKSFEVHAIERAYTAVVEGQLSNSSGTWKSFQYEDGQYMVHETLDETKGRMAITHYRTVSSSKRYSLVHLQLETGRKNQIRVHCQSAGHSVVGDKKYGAHSNPIKRLCLHAHLLAFQHPFSKKMVRFESQPPTEFARILASPSQK